MNEILFVDACMRGPELSRTWQLARCFLDRCTALRPRTEILHRDLTGGELSPLTAALARERDRLAEHCPDDPMLAPAREMQGADLVVIAAPYWDLSFPAALKVYLEWASTLGITFRYEKDGRQVGMSRARHLVYITTAGGPAAGQNLGYDYLRAWAAMVGIPATHCVLAENLDVRGAGVEDILSRASAQAAALARSLP